MPTYTYTCQCETCENFGKGEEVNHSMNETPEFLCPKCGKKKERQIEAVGFALKGFNGFASKAGRINKQREERNKELNRKQYERYGDLLPIPVPNVQTKDGEVKTFDSWTEAAKVAQEQGYDSKQYTEFGEKQDKIKKDMQDKASGKIE